MTLPDTLPYEPPTHKDVTVWLLIDAHGNVVADVDRAHLAGEWDADIGDFDPEVPSAVCYAVVRVPLPRCVELGKVAVG